jgi:uncharacterized protein YdeI (BOF family)
VERARATAAVALFAFLLAATVALAAAAPALRQAALEPLAVVGWPPSTLVVTEVQTGGASASDEFAEIGNMGSAAVDLAGLEVAYVTASGGTVTRKAAWTAPLLLEPGRHLVIANSSGVFASIADATYSGGFAATGGAIVLRVAGGAPVDALGWGDATNAFVEGSVAAAPVAGSSVERRPGGTAGNTTDTNDNLADFFAQAVPNPQNLAAPPVPAPGPTSSPPAPPPAPTGTPTIQPTPTPTPTPTAPTPTPAPSGTATPMPTPSATPGASGSTSPDPTLEPTPTAAPTPSATATPTTEPTPAATATTAPTPTPSPTPVASPTSTPSAEPSSSPEPTPAPTVGPSPSPAAIPIAEARALPDGLPAVVVGTLTTDLGALEAGRAGFVQDATAGIAIYLDAAPTMPLQTGTIVRLDGELDTRYGARTLRVDATAVVDLGPGFLPDAGDVATGIVGEELEGLRVTVTGTTIGSPTSFADGLGILVDDGSGSVRVIIGPDALAGAIVPSGTFVRAAGPVGQRDSTGTGTSGYRIHATEPGELEILPPPATPTPPPTPTPGPTATGTPTPAPTTLPTAPPTPTPPPAPSPSAAPAPTITIAEARGRTVGSVVTVAGVVTAEAGRLGTPSLLALDDATGGIIVRVPEGAAAPGRGTRLAISGPLAAPYGQLEIRPSTSGFRAIGSGPLPEPVEIVARELGEGSEGSLVSIIGTVTAAPRKSTSDDLAIDLVDASGTAFRVMADASSRLVPTDLRKGETYALVGIAGQRASKKDVVDGYRVWLRDAADVIALPGGATGATSTQTGSTSAQVMTIATVRRLDDDTPALVEGVVIAGPGLLDTDGRRIVIQDATGGIEVVLVAAAGAPAGGARIRVVGTVGHAWDAPRIRATEIVVLGTGPDVAARILGGAPGESVEWQLVRIAGTITDVTRLGDRWRADVRVGGSSVLVTGLAGAGIASTSLVEGRAVTVVGIVRRPYPTATDRRWTVIPRGPWDLAVGPASSGPARGAGGGGSSGAGSGGPGGPGSGAGASQAPYPGVPDVDLAALGDHLGELVRVGGLVVAGSATGFSLDDGTAIGRVELRGEAAAFLDLIEAGDAIGIVGRVGSGAGGERVVLATDPAGLVRLGSLGESVPLAAVVAPSGAAGPTFGPLSAAGMTDPLGDVDGGRLGLVGLALASLGSLLVTVARRRRADLGLRRVVATRITGLRERSGSAGSPFDRA